jgi:hypothetical protein
MDGRKCVALIVSLAVAMLIAPPARSQPGPQQGSVRLFGAQEVPVILTTGTGRFTFTLQRNRILWQLSYGGLQAAVTQAHIHIGQSGANGGIAAFLCSNLGNGPAGTQACPAAPATISGTIDADEVVAIAAQGLVAGDFGRLAAAMRNGLTYANVHSTTFQGGEVRGQIPHDH